MRTNESWDFLTRKLWRHLEGEVHFQTRLQIPDNLASDLSDYFVVPDRNQVQVPIADRVWDQAREEIYGKL